MFTAALLAVLSASAQATTGKQGLPFNSPATYLQHWNGTGAKVSWAYNWDSAMDSTFPTTNMEFVPMLWGAASTHTKYWAPNVATAKLHGSRHLLGFNEPDGCGGGQACLSPAAAVTAWKQYIQPYGTSFSLGAPVVTNGPAGLPWLKEFLVLCTGCKVDFVPVHWYDSATNIAYFKNYMASAYAAGGNRSLWITEFNGAGTSAQQVTFLQTVIPWLDSLSWMGRYAWQWCNPNFTGGTLVLSNGLPSPLGEVFGFSAYSAAA